MNREPAPQAETAKGEPPNKWRIPVWPVVLLMLLGPLAWDWTPYIMACTKRSQLLPLCEVGKPSDKAIAEARAQGANVSFSTPRDLTISKSVLIHFVETPSSVRWVKKHVAASRWKNGQLHATTVHLTLKLQIWFEADTSGIITSRSAR